MRYICMYFMKEKFISILIILLFNTLLFAQEQYKIQEIEGIEYYVYPVQKSEGLYRISVNFGVPQDEIIRINPEVKNGLKAGQIIFIPKVKDVIPSNTVAANVNEQAGNPSVRPQSNQQTTNQKTPPPADIIALTLGGKAPEAQQESLQKIELSGSEPHYYYHKVEKQQTLYSLSKQYEVAQEDIIKYNPGAANGLREGEILRIPKPEDIYVEKKAEKLREDLSVRYLIHKVEPKETLYSISKKYEVEIEDIVKLNEDMEVLSIDQELKIPYYTALLTTDTVNGETTTYLDWDKVLVQKDTVKITSLRIAFLLPFMLDNKNDANVSRFVDFYGGAIKAISEVKNEDIKIEVYTFDVERSKEKISEVLYANPVIKNADLIIGPAYSVQVPVITQFAKENKVKTLIPFTSKVADIENNPYIFQFNPGMDVELELLEEMFRTKFNDMNYIFADIANIQPNDEGEIISNHIKGILEEQNKNYEVITLTGPDQNLFDSAISETKKNFIIFNTDQFQLVRPYFESLNNIDKKYDIVLLERYSWKNQNSLRPAGVYISAFKAENDMHNLNEYNQDFVHLLGFEATSRNPRYDILGYDLVNYFINLLRNDDNMIMNELELNPYTEGIQSQFRFKRNSTNSGFINHQLYSGNTQIK